MTELICLCITQTAWFGYFYLHAILTSLILSVARVLSFFSSSYCWNQQRPIVKHSEPPRSPSSVFPLQHAVHRGSIWQAPADSWVRQS